VQLSNGRIRGREGLTYTNKQFYIFEKIPYAAPPVGELRFKAPIPPPSWDETLDTVSLDVICYQVGSNSEDESEDCLYINVYTPQVGFTVSSVEYSSSTTFSFPVMTNRWHYPSCYTFTVVVL
jgi:para-nitrobenzyl esterase